MSSLKFGIGAVDFVGESCYVVAYLSPGFLLPLVGAAGPSPDELMSFGGHGRLYFYEKGGSEGNLAVTAGDL